MHELNLSFYQTSFLQLLKIASHLRGSFLQLPKLQLEYNDQLFEKNNNSACSVSRSVNIEISL